MRFTRRHTTGAAFVLGSRPPTAGDKGFASPRPRSLTAILVAAPFVGGRQPIQNYAAMERGRGSDSSSLTVRSGCRASSRTVAQPILQQ